MSPIPAPRPRTGADRLAALPTTSVGLFVYGTLTFPDVLRALLGRVPQSEEASVEGWRALTAPNRSYPVLVSGRGQTRGLVLLNVRPEEWRIIDAYEDSIYQLRTLELRPARHQAVAYICPADQTVATSPWDRDHFAAEDLETYVEQCRRWSCAQ